MTSTTTTETTCTACNGSGLYLDADDWGGEVVCGVCLGEGVRSLDGGACSSCGGSGWAACSLCGDTGRIADDLACPRCESRYDQPNQWPPDDGAVDWASDIHPHAECDDRVAV